MGAYFVDLLTTYASLKVGLVLILELEQKSQTRSKILKLSSKLYKLGPYFPCQLGSNGIVNL